MDLSELDLSTLWFSGFNHMECREAVEAASGYKISRLLISRAKAQVLTKWARSYGVHVLTADFNVREGEEPEGKGAWINTGRRAAWGPGLAYAYVGRREADLVSAKHSDELGEDPDLLAGLLRIPDCCLSFYRTHVDEARTKHQNDYAPIVDRLTESPGPHSWVMNYVAQYFGYSIIHYYPCSWQCAPSRDRAAEITELMRRVSPAWVELTREMCTGTVIHCGSSGVHMIRGVVLSAQEQFMEDDVVSTVHDDVSARIKRLAGTRISPSDLLTTIEAPPFSLCFEFGRELGSVAGSAACGDRGRSG